VTLFGISSARDEKDQRAVGNGKFQGHPREACLGTNDVIVELP